MDELISWAGANPLLALGAMAILGVFGALFAVGPHLSEVVHHNHPRC